MTHKPRTRYQDAIGVIEEQATNVVLKDMVAAIQFVLGAPAELLSRERLGRIEAMKVDDLG